ncbi:helix-turn-helix domain-containing protein [Rheinheimera baltica]|uniref:helix-turn-helix domain-containing protein n=1 Tax=Rheinheimera baltica TaxID=67576 RepID=UPI0004897DD0|nr:helix-turn-helix transcriptional regulator [Rheinheimera baltica]
MSQLTTFTIRLKQARKAAGISQTELGLRSGFDPGSASSRMNHYEKGRHLPDLEAMKRMAKELNVPLAYFFCEGDDEAELVAMFGRITHEQKAEVLKLLKDQISSND